MGDHASDSYVQVPHEETRDDVGIHCAVQRCYQSGDFRDD